MSDVAVRAGVSRSLVSLVVRGSPLVSAERRASALAAIDELGYRHNAIASRLAAKSTRTLGLLLPDLHNPVFADVHDGVVEAAQAEGYEVLLAASSPDDGREAALIDRLITLQVDGIVLAGYGGPDERLRAIAARCPVVSVNRRVDAPGIDCVIPDEPAAAALVIDHLTALGHRRIAHVASPRGQSPERRAGFEAEMAVRGLEATVVDGGVTSDAGRQAVEAFAASGHWPTAIVAHNDISAVGVLSALRERSIDVPGEVSVVGYDDTDLAGLPLISLTSVQHHARAQGRSAASLAIERIGATKTEPRNVVIPPRLIVRRTSAAVRLTASVDPAVRA